MILLRFQAALGGNGEDASFLSKENEQRKDRRTQEKKPLRSYYSVPRGRTSTLTAMFTVSLSVQSVQTVLVRTSTCTHYSISGTITLSWNTPHDEAKRISRSLLSLTSTRTEYGVP